MLTTSQNKKIAPLITEVFYLLNSDVKAAQDFRNGAV
jgi:hypothetical protein